MYSLLEREVQFASQSDLQQAVAQDTQGNLRSFDVFYDQPARGVQGVLVQPGKAIVVLYCMSGLAGIRADPRRSRNSFRTNPSLSPSPDEEQ